MTDHLANQAIPLAARNMMATFALGLANAMIEQEIACYHNSRKHGQDDDSDKLMADAQAAIDAVFDIRKAMKDMAVSLSKHVL